MKRQSCLDTVQQVRSVTRSSDQLSDPDKVHSCLVLGIGVLDQCSFRLLNDLWDLRQLDEVIDPLALVLEVKAGVLEGEWEIDDRLTNILNLSGLGQDQLSI